MVTVDFTLSDAAIFGYQFTLNFDQDALELVDLTPGVVSLENFGLTMLEQGAITTSWNVADLQTFENETVLFSILLNVNQAGQLSDYLSISSR